MKRQLSLKAALGGLLAAVFIPLLATGGVFLTYEWIKQRNQALARLSDNALALRIAVDRELALDQAVLQALAASRDIDEHNWARFDAVARQTAQVRPGSWFFLLDREGQQIINTTVPFGASLPNIKQTDQEPVEWHGRKLRTPDQNLLLGPIEDGKPRFIGLTYGRVAKRPAVGNNVPVVRDGEARYSLTIAYGAEFFQNLVRSPADSAEMIKVIFDGAGLIVARNQAPEQFVGTQGAGAFQKGTAHLPADGVGKAISVEGTEVFYAFSRSTVNDWAVAVALPQRVVLAPAWRALSVWIASLGGVALIGAFFAVRLWHRVAGPLDALARQARSLGESQPPLPATDIEEVKALSGALHEAGKNAQALRESTAQLEQADRRRTEFLSMLSHELRNPLAAISNVTALLGREPDQRPQHRALHEMLQRQTRHLARMVDDLLDVARITRGKIRMRKELVRLDELVRQAGADARPMMDARAHRFIVTAGEEIWIVGDETRLTQIVDNLLENAAKYTHPGGEIVLEADRQGGEAVIQVRDNGPGIDSALLPHLFELFTQGPRTLDRSEGGLGIGLTLVKTIAQLHGGRVDVESDVGVGTEFTVRLPLAADAPSARAERAVGAAVIGLRILVVEDNVDAARSLAKLLQLAGNQVELAFDGAQGIEKARQWRPDAIVLDIGLPSMSGYDVCRALRAEPWGTGVPIIAVTGWGQEDDYRKSTQAGFDGHLVKPVDPDAVLSLLAALVTRQQPAAQR